MRSSSLFRRLVFLLAMLCMFPLASCGGAPSVAPSSAPATAAPPTPSPEATPEPTKAVATLTVTVDTSTVYQTFRGIGGSYCQANYMPLAQDAIGEFLLDDIKPKFVRVPIPLDLWELENDNGDPAVIDWDGFRPSGSLPSLFAMMQDMKANRGVESFVASVWNVAPWMVASKNGSTGGIIPEELMPEVAESICAWLVRARDEFGVEVDYVSINEPDLGVNVAMRPAEAIRFISIAGPLFQKTGLKTKFLVGDVSKLSPTTGYARKVLDEKAIAQYLGPISYHSWNSAIYDDSELLQLRDFAAEQGKPVWCCEFGFAPQMWKSPEDFKTWDTAWQLGNLLLRVIRQSGTEVVLYWQLQDNYPLLSAEDLSPYPSYYIIKQMAGCLKPGSRIVATKSSNEARLLSLAAVGEGDGFMLQLINRLYESVDVTVTGVPDGALKVVSTTEGEYMKPCADSEGSPRVIRLSPRSITTLYR